MIIDQQLKSLAALSINCSVIAVHHIDNSTMSLNEFLYGAEVEVLCNNHHIIVVGTGNDEEPFVFSSRVIV